MKFRKRMKKIVKKIDGLAYEAVDWYHSQSHAEKKVEQYLGQGYFADAIFEKDWAGWFVYIHCSKLILQGER